jgi:hypothetical protein
MNKTITYVLIGLVVLFGFMYLKSEFSKPTSVGGYVHNIQELFSAGIKAGSTNQLSIDSAGLLTTTGGITNTVATTTLGCLRVYQRGATTVASTTYYLVASTTVNTDNYFPLFATSTKPSYCN